MVPILHASRWFPAEWVDVAAIGKQSFRGHQVEVKSAQSGGPGSWRFSFRWPSPAAQASQFGRTHELFRSDNDPSATGQSPSTTLKNHWVNSAEGHFLFLCVCVLFRTRTHCHVLTTYLSHYLRTLGMASSLCSHCHLMRYKLVVAATGWYQSAEFCRLNRSLLGA